MRHALVALLIAAVPLAAGANDFILDSPSISRNGVLSTDHVFNGFGCKGKNVSPALQWNGAPQETQSYAITVFDPDAPSGSGWWHWQVFDIPTSTHSLPEGVGELGHTKLPEGAREGRSDYGPNRFGGACPPAGDPPHRYVFTIYALKVRKLDVPDDATAAMVGFNINANKIAEASFSATYGR
jgi:Raf kinase inhibitor-like YbhB/YbcL family protein